MTAPEPWPTEDAATKAVEAVARKAYEARASEGMPTWEDLPANEKVTVKQAVLSLVWTALEALPDPRHQAWDEGDMASDEWHRKNEARKTWEPRIPEPVNPYPSGL